MLNIVIIQQCQCIELNLMFFSIVYCLYNFIEGVAAGVVGAVVIVKFFWAVNADAD